MQHFLTDESAECEGGHSFLHDHRVIDVTEHFAYDKNCSVLYMLSLFYCVVYGRIRKYDFVFYVSSYHVYSKTSRVIHYGFITDRLHTRKWSSD
jgi:hypothetical protein